MNQPSSVFRVVFRPFNSHHLIFKSSEINAATCRMQLKSHGRPASGFFLNVFLLTLHVK